MSGKYPLSFCLKVITENDVERICPTIIFTFLNYIIIIPKNSILAPILIFHWFHISNNRNVEATTQQPLQIRIFFLCHRVLI